MMTIESDQGIGQHEVRTWRVYDHEHRPPGPVYLIDRVWPRGITKQSLGLAAWVRDAAPSTELRKWYGHDPSKWEEFQRRYREELQAEPGTWQVLREALAESDIVLAYGSHEQVLNNATVVREVLLEAAQR
ncbi:MAG TPA: DUF488 family protein [Actinomycetota bacterium]|nr:DUF488 family protein [Actinomycetota bacterium]